MGYQRQEGEERPVGRKGREKRGGSRIEDQVGRTNCCSGPAAPPVGSAYYVLAGRRPLSFGVRRTMVRDMIAKKTCPACRKRLSAAAFNGSARTADGLARTCRACINARRRQRD